MHRHKRARKCERPVPLWPVPISRTDAGAEAFRAAPRVKEGNDRLR